MNRDVAGLDRRLGLRRSKFMLFFPGSFRPSERDTLRNAISNLELRLRAPTTGNPSWAIYNFSVDGERQVLMAVRLTDGRAFRAPSGYALLNTLRAAERQGDTDSLHAT